MGSLFDYVNESNGYDRAKTIAINVVASMIPHVKSFKIGKTGEDVKDRLEKPDYKDEYGFTAIKEIYHTTSKSLASKMEADLIDNFDDREKCENKKGGKESIHDKMADTNDYSVYIVWK